MKNGLILAAALICCAAGPASERPYETYYAALKHQCPAKRLDWLAPGVLRGDLLAVPVSDAVRKRMEARSRTWCSEEQWTSTCGNAAALSVLVEEGRLDAFVAGQCKTWRSCDEPSSCERVKP